MNRAERRRVGHQLLDGSLQITVIELPVSMAIEFNTADPLPGLAPTLYAIRAKYGPHQMIRLTDAERGVEVLL